jgi:hypothetical protein
MRRLIPSKEPGAATACPRGRYAATSRACRRDPKNVSKSATADFDAPVVRKSARRVHAGWWHPQAKGNGITSIEPCLRRQPQGGTETAASHPALRAEPAKPGKTAPAVCGRHRSAARNRRASAAGADAACGRRGNLPCHPNVPQRWRMRDQPRPHLDNRLIAGATIATEIRRRNGPVRRERAWQNRAIIQHSCNQSPFAWFLGSHW